jgi:hypothetical protein
MPNSHRNTDNPTSRPNNNLPISRRTPPTPAPATTQRRRRPRHGTTTTTTTSRSSSARSRAAAAAFPDARNKLSQPQIPPTDLPGVAGGLYDAEGGVLVRHHVVLVLGVDGLVLRRQVDGVG